MGFETKWFHKATWKIVAGQAQTERLHDAQ
jgi:hypothetical protein